MIGYRNHDGRIDGPYAASRLTGRLVAILAGINTANNNIARSWGRRLIDGTYFWLIPCGLKAHRLPAGVVHGVNFFQGIMRISAYR